MSEYGYAVAVLCERKVELSKEQGECSYGTFGWLNCQEHIVKLESAIKKLLKEKQNV